MSGLDYLKSCATNVRKVEGILQTAYSIHELPNNHDSSNLYMIVTELRGRKIWCTLVASELWIFCPSIAEKEDWLEAVNGRGLILKEEHSSILSTNKHATDALLRAIEAATTWTLATCADVVRVGAWSWAYAAHVDDWPEQSTVLIQLDVRISETGALYLFELVQGCSLQVLFEEKDSTSERDVIVAPLGIRARLVNTISAVDTHDFAVWQSRNVLAMDAISLDASEQWTLLEISKNDNTARFIWPKRLCFLARHDFAERTVGKRSADWRQWFSASQQDSVIYEHPLDVAETCHRRAAQLEFADALSTTGDNPSSALSSSPGVMLSDTQLITSSPFNQRIADQQAAASGIYPTPPDGLASALLSFPDGPPTLQNGQSGAVEDDVLRPNSSHDSGRDLLPSGSPQEYDQAQDDLFGDVQEMDIGAVEVGDADFDYFNVNGGHPDKELRMRDQQYDDDNDDVEDSPIGADPLSEHKGSPGLDEYAQSDLNTSAVQDLGEIAPESHQTTARYAGAVAAGLGLFADIEAAPEFDAMDNILVSNDANRQNEPNTCVDLNQGLPVQRAYDFNGFTKRDLRTGAPADGTYEPVAFRKSLKLDNKYGAIASQLDQPKHLKDGVADITLPATYRKRRRSSASDTSTDGDIVSGSDAEVDSDTSLQEESMPPRLPWDTTKRRRPSLVADAVLNGEAPWNIGMEQIANTARVRDEEQDFSVLSGLMDSQATNVQRLLSRRQQFPESVISDLSTVFEHFDLSKLDMVYIADIVAHQANTTSITSRMDSDYVLNGQLASAAITSISSLMSDALENISIGNTSCTIEELASIKEPHPRAYAGQTVTPTMPRPRIAPREGPSGPDLFALSSPYIRVRRGVDAFEMLATARHFWTMLGLGPASGPKNVRALALVPDSEDLLSSTRDFIDDLGQAYESCKLGTHAMLHGLEISPSETVNLDDGILAVGAPSLTASAVLGAYCRACALLGGELAKAGHSDSETTFVIYMVDPFEDASERTRHYLCACFWMLCKSYRDTLRNVHADASHSQIVLQIIPVSWMASTDSMIIPDMTHMTHLAMCVYDQCPPTREMRASSTWPQALSFFVAPCVELACAKPTRINFQASAEPSQDLLHEGSILHLACAQSPDGQWVTACWTDATGAYQHMASLCSRGKSLDDLVRDIWAQTLVFLDARAVMWRVFVFEASSLTTSARSCWRTTIAAEPRMQALHVTLLSLRNEPDIQLKAPGFPRMQDVDGHATLLKPGQTIPGTTPQSNTQMMPPDVHEQGNAPATPPPSDYAASLAENNPDAHLVELADEAWAMLLSPLCFSSSSHLSSQGPSASMAHGLLAKRGTLEHESTRNLTILGVDLHCELRVRPNGAVDEAPKRQTEATLREVLKMYRELSVLSGSEVWNAAGNIGNTTCMPLHVLKAVRGAEALNGFLS